MYITWVNAPDNTTKRHQYYSPDDISTNFSAKPPEGAITTNSSDCSRVSQICTHSSQPHKIQKWGTRHGPIARDLCLWVMFKLDNNEQKKTLTEV